MLTIDGFDYNINYRALCGYYDSAILDQLDAIRKTNNYQPKYYAVPESGSVVVPAYGAYEYQVQVMRGTVIWGFVFYNASGAYSYNIFDSLTGRVASDGVLSSGTSPSQWQGQVIFPTAYFVDAAGLLSVEIGSLASTDSTVNTLQMVLLCLEPVKGCVDLCQ